MNCGLVGKPASLVFLYDTYHSTSLPLDVQGINYPASA
jgi:hypothetical protein